MNARRTTLISVASLAIFAGTSCDLLAMQPASSGSGDDAPRLIVTLNDSRLPIEARRRAAEELVRLADSLAIRDMLASSFQEPLAEGSASALLIRAIEDSPRLTMRLFQPLAAKLSIASSAEIPDLLRAIGRFKSRESVRLIAMHLRHPDAGVVQAAMESLAAISGRDDLPLSTNVWIAWSARVERLSELQWQDELIDALAAKANRLASERQASVGRLSASLRQLYLSTDPVQRSSLLAEWIGDPLSEVRDLGIELTRRELGSSTKLEPSVGAAALKLLDCDIPSVRARAAVLVRQLAPEGAAALVAAAVASENQSEPAAALLLAASRWPARSVVPAALSWLNRESIARDAAVEACNALARAAMMTPAQRETTLGIARALLTTSPTPALIALLWTIGDSSDADSIAPFLRDENPSLRLAAAECLLWSEDHLADVVDAASNNSELFDAASKAVVVHTPDAAGFATVAQLPAPSRDIRDAALVRLGRALTADALESALSTCEDGPATRALRLNLVSKERILAESSHPEALAAIARGMNRIAEEDLSAGRPDAALARLEAMPETVPVDLRNAAGQIKLLSYITLGRLELAEADPAADLPLWLRGLALISGKEHEEETIRRIESRFGDRIDATSASVLAAAKDRIAKTRAPQ